MQKKLKYLNQKIISGDIYNSLEKKELFNVPTGAGKTFIILDVAKKVLGENFICVFSAGQKLIEQLNKLNESEKKISSPNYRSEEIRAGINDFKKYGVMSLVRGIALKWGISKDDVFKWSYNEVLLELKISADENNYQRKLSEILNPKK